MILPLSLLVGAGLIGLWLLWCFWTSRYPHPAGLSFHALLGWSGVIGLAILFSLGNTWEVSIYQEGAISGFLLAGLFGILQGLIRIARRGTSTILITVHVGCALVGFGFLTLIIL
ncbi:MAG: hypothetical protein ABEK50_07750 [bacterium]